MIPFVNLAAQRRAYHEEFAEAEARVLDSGTYIGGPEVKALEDDLAAYTGVSNVVTCSSGTDAIMLSLMALGLKPGDEVIVPDFTFISPAECVCRLGGVPRFADICEEGFLIDPSAVEGLITERTVGVIAVHLFGQCAQMEWLRLLAQAHGLWLMGDAAQAFGATREGRQSVSLADVSITSFYPTKPLGSYGDGGAIFTENAELAATMRRLAHHGMRSRYYHEFIGLNSRLDAIQAAVLRVKLRHLSDELERRRKNAAKYDKFFSKFEGITTPIVERSNVSTFSQYTLRASDRFTWLSLCEKAEVPTSIYYPRILSWQPSLAPFTPPSKNRMAAHACHEVFSIPVCAFTDIDKIIDDLGRAAKETFQG